MCNFDELIYIKASLKIDQCGLVLRFGAERVAYPTLYLGIEQTDTLSVVVLRLLKKRFLKIIFQCSVVMC